MPDDGGPAEARFHAHRFVSVVDAAPDVVLYENSNVI
jgi:hypothetical protein